MKKYLLLLASATLLLVGCQKEKFADQQEGGMTTATFTASVDGCVATKAAADNDGNGAYVNRCIMEIYFGDALYKRMEAAMSGTPATATFANVPVVAGKTYKVLFWADCGNGLVDKYYTTTTVGKGLTEVAIKHSAFIDALKAGKNDKLDAFFFAQDYTVPQGGATYNDVKLYRPFAQLNVITTDVADGKTVTSADLLPEKVYVKYKAASTINVADGAVSADVVDYEYEASVYGNWATVTTNHELTLSMDYILAPAEQGAVDITFKTKNGTTEVMTHNLTNLPYKRNYRTNVKGDLLTTGGSWTATIAPDWGGVTTHPVVTATTLEEAQAAVGPATTGTEAAGTVIVKPEAVTSRNTVNDKTGAQIVETSPTISLDNLLEGAKAIEFVLTPQSKEDVTFELPALPADTETEKFYWYIRHEPNYPTKTLNVKVSDDDKTRVIIDAPDETHVVLNDVEYEHVIAITGQNTLVVPQGIIVDKLTVRKGGVEIHGTVNALEITGSEDEVFFRTSENLLATVFAKIKDEGYNYIDTPQYSEKLNSNGNWDIVEQDVVAKIDNTVYYSIASAIEAATSGQTITLLADIADAGNINLKPNVTLDGDNHKISGNSSIHINTAGGTVKRVVFENIHNTSVPSGSDISKYDLPADKVGTLSAIYGSELTGKLSISDCSFDNVDWDAIQITPVEGSTISIVDNTFKHTNTETSQVRHVHIETASYIDAFVTVTDNKFYDSKSEYPINDLGVYKVRKSKDVCLSGNWLETISNYDMTYPEMIYPARSQADVDVDDICPAAKKVVNPIKFYDTLREAFDDLVDIQLLKNTDENATVPAEFNKQLQMNEFRIQSTITNNGTVDIFSSISDAACTGTIINNGSLKIRSCDDVNGLKIVNNGKLEIVATNTDGVADISTITNNDGGRVEISGGTFNAKPKDEWILWGYQAVDNGNGTFTVVKRTFADDAEALAAGAVVKYTKSGVSEYFNSLANGGTNDLHFLTNITEDVIRTGTGAYFYADNFKYTGSLDATGKDVNFKTGVAEFNSLKSAKFLVGKSGTAGVEVTVHDGKVTGKVTVYSPAVLRIDGGTFTNSSSTAAVAVNSGATLIITGGTFKSEQFKPYIAEGYEAVDNGDGTWSVKLIN